MKNKTVLVIFRLVLGAVFVYSGVVKALAPLDFAQGIRNYRIVGSSLSFLVALILPWLEILAGLSLAAGIWKRASALLVSMMLAFFIVLAAVTILRGIDVDCGCFGALGRKADLRLILEDGAMLFMAVSVLLAPDKPRPPD